MQRKTRTMRIMAELGQFKIWFYLLLVSIVVITTTESRAAASLQDYAMCYMNCWFQKLTCEKSGDCNDMQNTVVMSEKCIGCLNDLEQCQDKCLRPDEEDNNTVEQSSGDDIDDSQATTSSNGMT